MPKRPPVHDPHGHLPAVPKHKPKASRQAGRFLHTGSAQWRAIRTAQLERFPLCEDCEGPAIEVDHNTDDTSRNLIGVELSSLCKPCHSKRTAARLYGRDKPRIIGCDVNGWPLDPEHHWNVEHRVTSQKSLEGEQPRHVRPASHARPQMGDSGDE